MALQRQGLVPPGGVERVADFQAILVSFEPQTKAQEALHDATMRQFNSFFDYRRTWLYSVNSGIPALLWYTVGVGALINMIFIWLFNLRLNVHRLLGRIISFFLATMICLIALRTTRLGPTSLIFPKLVRVLPDQPMTRTMSFESSTKVPTTVGQGHRGELEQQLSTCDAFDILVGDVRTGITGKYGRGTQ